MQDWIGPIITTVSAILGPLVMVQIMMHRVNRVTLAEIKQKTNHIDDCLDELKKAMARSTDHGARINRLEDRIFRIEKSA